MVGGISRSDLSNTTKCEKVELINSFRFEQALLAPRHSQHKDIQHNDIQTKDIQTNDIQPNDTQHNNKRSRHSA
jgi:hypothetical protein